MGLCNALGGQPFVLQMLGYGHHPHYSLNRTFLSLYIKETKEQNGEDTSQNKFSQSLSNLKRGEKLNTIQDVYEIFCFCYSQTNICLIMAIKGNIIFVNIISYNIIAYI